MPNNPPEGMPRITPYLFYADVEAALAWLEQSFGLTKAFQLEGPDGRVMHAEMRLEDGVIMMGPASEERGSKPPNVLGGVHQGLYIFVDDVDAHCRHAKQAGAEILMEPVDMFWGDRMYSARDLEGHQWSFAQHVRDIAPEDMKPSLCE